MTLLSLIFLNAMSCYSLHYFIHFRHLLSDQTDPFNRSPLSMDLVIPNVELAEEIRKWIEERKAQ